MTYLLHSLRGPTVDSKLQRKHKGGISVIFHRLKPPKIAIMRPS